MVYSVGLLYLVDRTDYTSGPEPRRRTRDVSRFTNDGWCGSGNVYESGGLERTQVQQCTVPGGPVSMQDGQRGLCDVVDCNRQSR